MGTKTKAVEATKVVAQATEEKVEIPMETVLTAFRETLLSIDLRMAAIEGMLKERIKQGSGRGPLSTRSMTPEDAKKIMTGDMKDKSIKECATDLGLSYGQVYSARNGYTFKGEYALRMAAIKAAAAEKK